MSLAIQRNLPCFGHKMANPLPLTADVIYEWPQMSSGLTEGAMAPVGEWRERSPIGPALDFYNFSFPSGKSNKIENQKTTPIFIVESPNA